MRLLLIVQPINVEKADIENELADAVNHLAVANLATVAKENKIKLIHFSTDYVFDGFKNYYYDETDKTNPLNAYGLTKLMGEFQIFKINPENSLIIRTSWLYSSYGVNFFKKILLNVVQKKELNMVEDQIGSPTNAKDLVKMLMKIIPKIDNKSVELFHYCNEGSCSWYEFAKEIFEFKKISTNLNPISTLHYNSKINRPKYSALNSEKIKNLYNLRIPNWKVSLHQFLKDIKE